MTPSPPKPDLSIRYGGSVTISLRTPESVPPPGPSFDGVGMLLLWTDGQPEFRFLSMDSGIGESEVGRQEWALRHLKIFFKVLLLRTKKLSQEPPPPFWKTFKDTYKMQRERSQVKVSTCIVFLFFLVNIFCECALLQKYLEARTTNPDLFKEKKCSQCEETFLINSSAEQRRFTFHKKMHFFQVKSSVINLFRLEYTVCLLIDRISNATAREAAPGQVWPPRSTTSCWCTSTRKASTSSARSVPS